ncbi:MAG: hypothetical protein GY755_23615, partial [Chloroflexi bacterium]|nr:hypothetical protein [Chloroflexota bacterium]
LKKQYGNGDVIDYLYDQGKRLTSKETKNSAAALINKYVYGYNKVHMKTFEQRGHDGNKGDVYGYDEVHRLKNVKFNAPDPQNLETIQFEKSKSISFDKVDNIRKIISTQNDITSEITTSLEGTRAKLNQYTSFDGWGLSYDLNGNTTQKGTQRFYYDYRNQLVRATDNSTTTGYKYDAFGRRIEKSYGVNVSRYYYSGNQVIEERNASDQVAKQFTYGNGIDEILRIEINENGTMVTYYVHTDSIGSVTAITDAAGNIVERISYDIYGMPTFTDYRTDPQNPTVVENSIMENDILFQGRRYDRETNLYYYRARDYDPIMGRFLQTDPMGYHDSMNMYQAFNMNGVNFVDPYGKEVIDIKLKVAGPNEMKKIKSPELGRIPNLGPKSHRLNWGYAVNIVATFTEDDSGGNYDPVQTAFVVHPDINNTNRNRPGKARTIMPDNPSERFVERSKEKLVWGDNPGLTAGGKPKKAFNLNYLAFFTSTVKPKKNSAGKSTDKIVYWAVKIIVKRGKIVDSKAGHITKEQYNAFV